MIKQGNLVTRNFNDIPLYVEKVDDNNLYVYINKTGWVDIKNSLGKFIYRKDENGNYIKEALKWIF